MVPSFWVLRIAVCLVVLFRCEDKCVKDGRFRAVDKVSIKHLAAGLSPVGEGVGRYWHGTSPAEKNSTWIFALSYLKTLTSYQSLIPNNQNLNQCLFIKGQAASHSRISRPVDCRGVDVSSKFSFVSFLGTYTTTYMLSTCMIPRSFI